MTVRLTRRDEFAIMTLDRPATLNALSFALIGEISEAIDKVAAMPVRALVITGEGPKAFCAGADISELQHRDLAAQRSGARLGQSTFAKLDSLPVASVAAINGYAFGGGLELALACTFRIAVPSAKMGLPEIKLGLVPGYGGTQRLPRVIGAARALDMIMTGRTVTADEAVQIGLVHAIADGDPVDAAIDFAKRFTGFGLPALRFAREAVIRGLEASFEEGLRIEADLSTLAYRTADAAEGMEAFVQKRPPVFADA